MISYHHHHTHTENNTNNITVNGISSHGITTTHTQEQQNRVHLQQVQHTQGPWDGSLYATVNKQQQQQQQQQLQQHQQQRQGRDHIDGVSNNLMHNGPAHLPNGSLTSSVDSGLVPLPPFMLIFS